MPKNLSFTEGLNFLSPYIKNFKHLFITFYIGYFLESIITVMTPIIFSIMIDEIVYYKNLEQFIRISTIFVYVSIFSCILYFLLHSIHHYIMTMYTFQIRLDVFNKFQAMHASDLTHIQSGDIITLLLKDTSECVHFIVRNGIHFLNAFIMGLLYILYIYVINVKAGIIITLFIPLYTYISSKYSKKIRSFSDKERKAYGTYVSWLLEMFKGLTDIRLLAAETTISKKFSAHLHKLFKLDKNIALSNLTSTKIIEAFNLIMQLTIYTICAYLAFTDHITIGNVILLLSFVTALKNNIIFPLVNNTIDAQNRLTRINRIKSFLDTKDESCWAGKENLHISKGTISFEHIDFAYEKGNLLLKDFNLKIPGGYKIACVGASGCGKTTLTSLLLGFYSPASGKILIDEQDITTCSLKSIRQQIGIVQQEILIFDGSIRENLLLVKPHASEEEIWTACEKAGIATRLKNLPNLLDTIIGKEGIHLSGGEIQRLGIARIYLKNPPILIFDEATSALDHQTEACIHQAWQDLLKNRTAIIIAHRLSSVMQCPHTLLMENGQVQVFGPTSELIQHNSSFRNLFTIKEEPLNAQKVSV